MKKLWNKLKKFLGIRFEQTYLITYKLRADQKIPFDLKISLTVDDVETGACEAVRILKESLPKCYLVDIEPK